MYVNPKAKPITFSAGVLGEGIFTFGNRCPRCFSPAGHACVTKAGRLTAVGHQGRTVVRTS